MALAGECDNALASSLSDLPQRPEWTNRSARAELLGKLAPRDLLWSISVIDFALRNRPGATIFLAPERTAGVNEQNLEPASAISGRPERPRSSSISWKWFSAQPYRFHSAEQSSAEQRRRRRDDADSAAEIVRSSTVAQRASDTPQRADFPQCPGTPSCRGEEFQTSRRSAGFKNCPGQPRQFPT